MKLLIVEDDRLLSNALARSLRDAYAVDQAFDGEEGLFYAAQDVYDLVVLDVMLPERDGFSVLEALRAQGVDTPVLMLTARSATADKLRGLRSGADDYLAKPFDRDELLARIEAILRRTTGRRLHRRRAPRSERQAVRHSRIPGQPPGQSHLERAVVRQDMGIHVGHVLERRGGVRERAAQSAGSDRLRSLHQDHPRSRLPVHGGRS